MNNWKKCSSDDSRINLIQPHVQAFWARTLGVTKANGDFL
jgi:hypothetical protein